MNNKKIKKCIAILFFICLFIIILVSFFYNNSLNKTKIQNMISVAIVCANNNVDGKNTYELMKTSTIANSNVEMITNLEDLSKYDVLLIDKSAIEINKFDYKKIQEFVKNGGNVFLDNSLYNQFDKEFIGAKEFVLLDECPIDMQYPEVSKNLSNLQELIKDFSYIYQGYGNFNTLAKEDYGVGVLVDTAYSLAAIDETSVYTLNKYGNGYVFFSNPLLPNLFSVNNLSEENKGEYLSITTVGANKMIRDYFLEFISLSKYGYAVEHVYGTYGTPSASWQLHFEDIRGIQNKSSIIFYELLKENGQVPSFTFARSPYTWFKRSESVTYVLSEGGKYVTDPYEDVFSSGTHFATAGNWLELSSYDNTISYFEDSTDYIKRAYPCPIDLNKDDKMDLIVGSSDGFLYYYQGSQMKSNYELNKGEILIDDKGNPISTGTYSSPTLGDIDNDGIDEIITGSEDGTIKWFKHKEGLVFEDKGIVVETNMADSMPSIGDLNHDGIIDLAVGSRNGNMRVYYGNLKNGNVQFNNYIQIETEENWISPTIADLDNDGINDLLAGTQDGYIACFKYDGGKYYFDDYIENNTYNYKGNKYIKFGNNSIIRFYDINKDGNLDIIAGALEYGMAIPIDSNYFPFKTELQEQIDYLKERDIYIGAHILSSQYSSLEDDRIEVGFHKEAFNKYGISWNKIGANQHTWYTSALNDNKEGFDGTYKSQVEAGVLWNNGSKTPNTMATPESCAENTITIPFYLDNGLLMMQPSNILYGNSEYSNLSLKYEVPLLFYYHCDFAYEGVEKQYNVINKINYLLANNNYNLIQENQLAKIIAATYNTKVLSSYEDGILTIKPETKDKSISLYDEDYQNATGVKIIFSEEVNIEDFNINANVYYTNNNAIYVSLDDAVTISKKSSINKKINIISVNLPAKILRGEDNAIIEFLDGGMMEVTVKGDYTTSDKEWIVINEDETTTFRKYGQKDTLNIRLK